MLDVFIIEELRRREEDERRRSERPTLDLPVHDDDALPQQQTEDADEADKVPERGVVVIDL